MRRAAGLTLIELIIAIVVIGIGVTGIMLVYTTTIARSADPMIQEQAVAIAEAYLEEILVRPLAIGPETTPRANFDDVFDYHGLSGPPADQFGTPLGLANYTVTVTVTGAPPEGLGGIPGADVARVDVQVAHTSGISVTLSAYRTNY